MYPFIVWVAGEEGISHQLKATSLEGAVAEAARYVHEWRKQEDTPILFRISGEEGLVFLGVLNRRGEAGQVWGHTHDSNQPRFFIGSLDGGINELNEKQAKYEF